MNKKDTGGWLVHHAKKLQNIADPTEFENILAAGKAAQLLSALSASEEESALDPEKVRVLARNTQITKLELPGVLLTLERAHLIDQSRSGHVQALGLTTAKVLEHTADIFEDLEPRPEEVVSLSLAEKASRTPLLANYAEEYVSDRIQDAFVDAEQLLQQYEAIGFLDAEAIDGGQKLFFNGNLFRRDGATKTAKVLQSLRPDEQEKVLHLEEALKTRPCLSYSEAEGIVGEGVLRRLVSIGMYDVNQVSNERESYELVTKPAAFAKYGRGDLEDALDLAKTFATSLTYGMIRSPSGRGRITELPVLVGRLLEGHWVGPATAIGEDYRVLELRRVVELTKVSGSRFSMRLLKKDVGEMALQALTTGDVSEAGIQPMLCGAAVTSYTEPERKREQVRRKRLAPTNRRAIVDSLRTLRKGGDL